MATSVYLRMVGKLQGSITGSITTAPYHGAIKVVAIAHEDGDLAAHTTKVLCAARLNAQIDTEPKAEALHFI